MDRMNRKEGRLWAERGSGFQEGGMHCVSQKPAENRVRCVSERSLTFPGGGGSGAHAAEDCEDLGMKGAPFLLRRSRADCSEHDKPPPRRRGVPQASLSKCCLNAVLLSPVSI